MYIKIFFFKLSNTTETSYMLLHVIFLHHDAKILLWGRNTNQLTLDLFQKANKVKYETGDTRAYLSFMGPGPGVCI